VTDPGQECRPGAADRRSVILTGIDLGAVKGDLAIADRHPARCSVSATNDQRRPVVGTDVE
jgi:hypothetical protein